MRFVGVDLVRAYANKVSGLRISYRRRRVAPIRTHQGGLHRVCVGRQTRAEVYGSSRSDSVCEATQLKEVEQARWQKKDKISTRIFSTGRMQVNKKLVTDRSACGRLAL